MGLFRKFGKWVIEVTQHRFYNPGKEFLEGLRFNIEWMMEDKIIKGNIRKLWYNGKSK